MLAKERCCLQRQSNLAAKSFPQRTEQGEMQSAELLAVMCVQLMLASGYYVWLFAETLL